jgi:putative acyl-CoA dehydrogenase
MAASCPRPTLQPEALEMFLNEIDQAHGANVRLDAFADDLGRRLSNPARLEPAARRAVEIMAFALQASLLVGYSSAAVADAFCARRLDGDWGRAFGTMPQGLDSQVIVDR